MIIYQMVDDDVQRFKHEMSRKTECLSGHSRHNHQIIIMGFCTVATCFFGISTLMELILSYLIPLPSRTSPLCPLKYMATPTGSRPTCVCEGRILSHFRLEVVLHMHWVMVCAMMCHEPRKRAPCLFPEFFLLLTWISPKNWWSMMIPQPSR